MAIFAIALNNPADEVFRDRIELLYPSKKYEFSPTLFFVQDDNIPDVIARRLGIKVENDTDRIASGVVFRLEGSYAGYTSRALWDWLDWVGE